MKKMSTFQLAATSALIAIIVLLDISQLGLINLGIINITTLGVIVVCGTLLLGLKSGMILGACFGLISMLNALGITRPPTALVAPLVGKSPLLTILMCIVPRLLIPVTTHFSYRLLSRGKERAKWPLPIAAVIGSLTNTVFYMGFMLLFYTWIGLDSAPVLTAVATLIAGASIGEAAAAALITSGVIAAGWAVLKKRG